MSENTPKTKRLFVGGLFDEVTPEDLKQRFAKYGNVMSVDLKAKRNSFGDIVKTFAFIDFDSTPAKLKQCIDVFNKTKWKGRELRIQPAEDSFLDKLAKERQSQSVVKIWSPEQHKPGYNKEPQHLKVKGAPGTAIEGKEGWVVGKYSQPVPVLRVKRGDGKKVSFVMLHSYSGGISHPKPCVTCSLFSGSLASEALLIVHCKKRYINA